MLFRSFVRQVLCIASFTLLVVPGGWGQLSSLTDDQSAPIPGAGHDYIRMLSEKVNPANGSVSLRIQVPVPPGRKLTIPFAFAYDSSGVDHAIDGGLGYGQWTSDEAYLSQGGWSYSVPMLTVTEMTRTAPNPGGGSTRVTSTYPTCFRTPAAAGTRWASPTCSLGPTARTYRTRR